MRVFSLCTSQCAWSCRRPALSLCLLPIRLHTSYCGNFSIALALSFSVGSPYPAPTLLGACPVMLSDIRSEISALSAICLNVCRHPWFGESPGPFTPRLPTHSARRCLTCAVRDFLTLTGSLFFACSPSL